MEEISRQGNIQTGIWLLFAAFIQVYSEKKKPQVGHIINVHLVEGKSLNTLKITAMRAAKEAIMVKEKYPPLTWDSRCVCGGGKGVRSLQKRL